MVQLPREYKNNTSPWSHIAIGCGMVVGGVLLFWFASGILNRGFGVLLMFAGIIGAIRSYWPLRGHTIKCTPTGFSVLSENARREDYAWGEVTSTSYEYVPNPDPDWHGIIGSFSVETGRGRAFKVNESGFPFHELITVFNEQTPQLPYIWARDSTPTGWVLDGTPLKPDYNRIPRLPQANPPAFPTSIPPPLPPSN
jgi:hypothetical protein